MKHAKLISLFAGVMIVLTLTTGCKKKDDPAANTTYSSTSNGGNGGNTGNSLTLGSNSPVAVGGTLMLTASTVSGASYYWTGPAGFYSSAQNPSRANFTTTYAGSYKCTATVGYGSSYSASINVESK